ncbi:MAG: hypothetical protein HC890_11285, partial [Chloroflexaceae bacterium]|nr:hypothetical protein [Chloroflexaceae bacterium]
MTRLVSPALPQTTLMVIAIDFGTSNTAIARWNPATAQPEMLSLPGLSQTLANNPPLIPSLLYVEDAAHNQVIAGQAVRDRGLDLSRDPRCFRSFKRGIGTAVQGFLPNLEGVTVTFEQVGQWFLGKILQELENLGEKPQSLVLTVPVDSFEPYRNWLNAACETWAIPRIQLLDEPTAAAWDTAPQAWKCCSLLILAAVRSIYRWYSS